MIIKDKMIGLQSNNSNDITLKSMNKFKHHIIPINKIIARDSTMKKTPCMSRGKVKF